MRKIILVLALIQPLAIYAKRISPINPAEYELGIFDVWYWTIVICGFIILLVIALIVDGFSLLQRKLNPKPYSLDKGEYVFFCYANSKCFKEAGEQPKATYKGISKAILDSIYLKDGKYYYYWRGRFLLVEESPYFGDITLGEWGKYKYRYKVVYESTKFCQQGWCYFYFNFCPHSRER